MHKLGKFFTFEAAHHLPNVPCGHRCGHLHGHSYRVEIIVSGEINEKTGWLMDFGDIKKAFTPILEQLDHSNLNDIPGLENPTSEVITRWIWRHLKPSLPLLSEVILFETETSCCSYSE